VPLVGLQIKANERDFHKSNIPFLSQISGILKCCITLSTAYHIILTPTILISFSVHNVACLHLASVFALNPKQMERQA